MLTRRPSRSLRRLALLGALLVSSIGPAAAETRTPVILVPGVTGTELLDRSDPGSVRVAWGVGRNLIWPRDGGYALALPIGGDVDTLVAGSVIEEIRLFRVFHSDVYRPIVESLEGAGYRRGDLASPRLEDSLFLFGYDWRQDSVASAHALVAAIERIRSVRGEPRLDVDLICQSGGAHICRYAIKYGLATLAEAEAGGGGVGADYRVPRLILVGSSNGGSLRILRELIRGRSYIPWVGRRWRPEVLFSFPSLYQDLPAPGAAGFVDEAGAPVAVDLYDAESWRRYGWSALDPRRERRMARAADRFATPQERMDFLAGALARGARFARVLAAEVGFERVCSLRSIQSRETPTPVGAVLQLRRRGWRTRFAGDRWVERRPGLAALVGAPGDGHASIDSQLALSASESAKMKTDPLYVNGSHFRLILNEETRRHLIEVLAASPSEVCTAGGM